MEIIRKRNKEKKVRSRAVSRWTKMNRLKVEGWMGTEKRRGVKRESQTKM